MNYRFMFHLFVFVTISIILLIFTGPKASSLGLLFLLFFFVIIVFLYVNELLELYNWIRTLPETNKSLKTKGKKISYKELIKTGMVKFLFGVIPMIIIPVVMATIFMAVIIQNKDFISQLVMAISQNSYTSNIPKMTHESISINNLIASNSGIQEDINAIAFLSRNKPFYQKVIGNYELKSSFALIHNDHYAFYNTTLYDRTTDELIIFGPVAYRLRNTSANTIKVGEYDVISDVNYELYARNNFYPTSYKENKLPFAVEITVETDKEIQYYYYVLIDLESKGYKYLASSKEKYAVNVFKENTHGVITIELTNPTLPRQVHQIITQ